MADDELRIPSGTYTLRGVVRDNQTEIQFDWLRDHKQPDAMPIRFDVGNAVELLLQMALWAEAQRKRLGD